jgi:hypothetical protein
VAPKAAAPKPAAKPAVPSKPRRPRIPFPKKNAPPSEAEFAARLPIAAGKRFEAARAFLKKQKGISEELYYFGPKTGWAYRYLRNVQQSICSILIHDERLLGMVALEPGAVAAIDWQALSPVGQQARKIAHGSPALLWLDLPLEASGAADFKAIIKAKLGALPVLPPPVPGPAPAAGAPPARPTR